VLEKPDERDQVILRMKERGFSNRGVAQRLGLTENSIRKRLRRLGWKPQSETCLPFSEKSNQSKSPNGADTMPVDAESSRPAVDISGIAKTGELSLTSFAANPLDRSLDRLLAAMGKLEDAMPMFVRTENLPGADVLLAIPALVNSGLLSVAHKILWDQRSMAFGQHSLFPYCCLFYEFRGRKHSRNILPAISAVSLGSIEFPR
jgi:hypothetical protein